MHRSSAEVLRFWFETLEPEDWWVKNPALDERIREAFLDTHALAAGGDLDAWAAAPESLLALIIVLDQFPRNMFRGTARMYENDEKALTLAHDSIEAGHDREVPAGRRLFFYLPLEHSERVEDQHRYRELVTCLNGGELSKPGEAHRRIIERFGRFPHRNAILGRQSTPEEIEFLKEDGSSF